MEYLVKKNFSAKGYFTECIDDSCPDIGSYSKNISISFSKGEVINVYETGRPNWCKLPESNYGVSLHGSDAYIEISVEDLLKEGAIVSITNEEREKIIARKTAQQDYYIAAFKVDAHKDYLDYLAYENNHTQSYIDEYMKLVLEEIHTRANYIICSL